MSNAVSQRALDAGGDGQFVTRLSGPAAWGVPGGPNLASMSNAAGGDLRLFASGGPGLALQAGSGNVGVGTLAPAYPLDVSGAIRASYFVDPSGNRLLANAAAMWSSGATAFRRDDGVALSVGSGGSLTCRYFWFGAMVTAEIKMTLGSGASLGLSTQGWCWTLPVPPAATSMDANVGSAVLRSSGGVCYVGAAYSTAYSTVKVCLDGVSSIGVTLDAPFAWQTGDSLSLLLSYEASGVQQPAYAVPVGLTQSATAGSNCLGLGLAPGAAAPAGSFVVAGSVGIGGVFNPSVALDVSGSICATGSVLGSVGTFAQLYASNVAVLGSIETVNAYETHSSNVTIANAGTGPALLVSQTETGPLGPQPVAAFYAGSNVAVFVDSLGHVGIGKGSAGSNVALDVSGSVAVSGPLGTLPVAQFSAGSNVALVVDGAGNVAIGGKTAAAAAYALDVSGSIQATGLNVSGTSAITLASGTAAQKPSAPIAGMMRYNTTLSQIEYYSGSAWASIPGVTGNAKVSGGNYASNVSGYNVLYFTSSETLTVSVAGNVEVLVVAGGGGGGCRFGGGGGAGGVVYYPSYNIASGAYAITVGAGGSGGLTDQTRGSNGGNSSLGSLITAIGGGGGGCENLTGLTGGSGGGGGYSGGKTPGDGTVGQGFAGGSGWANPTRVNGGGGGAGGIGKGYGTRGDGGDGIPCFITGVPTFYGGGGGGSDCRTDSSGQGAGIQAAGYGGKGGGGWGGGGNSTGYTDPRPGTGVAGDPNTGGGGGGGSYYSPIGNPGGNGGSGIVIVRSLK